MYCQKCGKENPDDHKFCKDCGAPLYPTELSPKSTYRYSPEPTFIITAFAIILAMYILPVIPSPLYGSITLAKYQSQCSDFFECSGTVAMWFYAGWLLAVFLLTLGLTNKTNA